METVVIQPLDLPEPPDLKIKRIVTTGSGGTMRDCIYDPYALSIPGFIPVRPDAESEVTFYINADKILAIVIADEEQQHMRTDLIAPKEYKERG